MLLTDVIIKIILFWLLKTVQQGKRDIENGVYKKFMMPDMQPLMAIHLQGAKHYIGNTAKLIQAGALSKMGMANDAGFGPISEANVDIELGMFQLCHTLLDREFKGIDALRIATINGARSLGIEKEFGSIEAGKYADLVVIEGDPLKGFPQGDSHRRYLKKPLTFCANGGFYRSVLGAKPNCNHLQRPVHLGKVAFSLVNIFHQ